jgi:hypothetical protein
LLLDNAQYAKRSLTDSSEHGGGHGATGMGDHGFIQHDGDDDAGVIGGDESNERSGI